MINTDSLYQSPYDVSISVGITTSRVQCPAGYAVIGVHYSNDTTITLINRVRGITLACKAIDVGTPTDGIYTGSAVYVSEGQDAPSTSAVHTPDDFAAIGIIAGVRANPNTHYLKGFSVNYRQLFVHPGEHEISDGGNSIENADVTHMAGPSNGSGGNIESNDCGDPTYGGSFNDKTFVKVLVGFGTHTYSVIYSDGSSRIGGPRQLC